MSELGIIKKDSARHGTILGQFRFIESLLSSLEFLGDDLTLQGAMPPHFSG